MRSSDGRVIKHSISAQGDIITCPILGYALWSTIPSVNHRGVLYGWLPRSGSMLNEVCRAFHARIALPLSRGFPCSTSLTTANQMGPKATLRKAILKDIKGYLGKSKETTPGGCICFCYGSIPRKTYLVLPRWLRHYPWQFAGQM